MSTSTTVRVRPILVQPEAADDVAAGFAVVEVSAPVDGTVELAGSERFHLDELAHRVDAGGGARRYVVIGLLAAGLGLQNATVRRLAVPDVTTTVLTLTLTGLAADSWLAGGHSPRAGRRWPQSASWP